MIILDATVLIGFLDANDPHHFAATDLARVRNTYRLRMPDAVALHTALATASELATFDDALGSAVRQAGVLVTGR